MCATATVVYLVRNKETPHVSPSSASGSVSYSTRMFFRKRPRLVNHLEHLARVQRQTQELLASTKRKESERGRRKNATTGRMRTVHLCQCSA